MALTIRHFPDPVLAKRAEEVTDFNDSLKSLASDMAETMYEGSGIGLAAPQVGVSKRLIVVDVTGPSERQGLITLVNPELVELGEEIESEEGCLSLPTLKCWVPRHETATVKAQDLEGKPILMPVDGLMAVCLQHEIDHLNGTLILDRTGRLKRAMYLRKVAKTAKRKG